MLICFAHLSLQQLWQKCEHGICAPAVKNLRKRRNNYNFAKLRFTDSRVTFSAAPHSTVSGAQLFCCNKSCVLLTAAADKQTCFHPDGASLMFFGLRCVNSSLLKTCCKTCLFFPPHLCVYLTFDPLTLLLTVLHCQ